MIFYIFLLDQNMKYFVVLLLVAVAYASSEFISQGTDDKYIFSTGFSTIFIRILLVRLVSPFSPFLFKMKQRKALERFQ